MIRYTTFKLKNYASDEPIFSAAHANTSDSILDQAKMDVPYITDKFEVKRMQTVNHSWLSKKQHAITILCKISKFDYELISFKEKQLNNKISRNDFLQF